MYIHKYITGVYKERERELEQLPMETRIDHADDDSVEPTGPLNASTEPPDYILHIVSKLTFTRHQKQRRILKCQ